MTSDPTPLGLSSRQVCNLLGLPSSTLNYWVQVGVIRPQLRPPQGRRVEQYWTIADVVALKTVRQLRRAGASLQQVRKAAREVARSGSELSQAVLYWDGRDILISDGRGNLISTVRRPGQMVWLLTRLPLKNWYKEARDNAHPVDLAAIRDRDRKRKQQQRRAAELTEHLIQRR